VENAVKFGGAAEVEVSVDGAQAVIRVSDRGPGLPEDELERVFEPFRRLEPSRSRATGGAGLGLAVARSIARAHGGDVTLHNREGGGLTAEARLPLSA
jgi:signal transduction histidine kinase